jgi:hypothetical protein
VVGGVRVVDARPPERGAKHNDRQEEENSRNLEPEDAAYPAKWLEEPTDTLAGDTSCLGSDLARCKPGIPTQGGARGLGWTLRNPCRRRRGSGDALPGNATCHAHANPQGAPNDSRLHPIYDGSSGLSAHGCCIRVRCCTPELLSSRNGSKVEIPRSNPRHQPPGGCSWRYS